MGLSITVLGCDGSFAAAGGACSGYLVRSDTTALWLDCGPGTLANLQDVLPLHDLDALVVSHQHPDHFGELPVLYNALAFYVDRPPLPVYTTAGTYDLTATVNGHDCRGPLDWTLVEATDRVSVGDAEVSFSRTDHPVETLAVRVDAGERSVVYSSDTGPAWEPGEFLDGVDVFVCDATLLAHQVGVAPHLSAGQAAAMAARAGVGSLVLTHRNPGSDPEPYRAEAMAEFDGPVHIAEIGATFTA